MNYLDYFLGNPFLMGIVAFPIILLNITTNGKITDDPLFSHDKKLLLIVALWTLPVLGYFIVRGVFGESWPGKKPSGDGL
jgi:hypothetical protein